jgi:hypothetical protein
MKKKSAGDGYDILLRKLVWVVYEKLGLLGA